MRRRLSLPLVDSWFDLLPPPQQALARSLHALVQSVEPGFDLSIRSGHLNYGYERQHVLALAPHRQHLHLQVFVSPALASRFPLLEAAGNWPRQIRLRYAQPYDAEQIHDIVHAVVQAAQAARSAVPERGLP